MLSLYRSVSLVGFLALMIGCGSSIVSEPDSGDSGGGSTAPEKALCGDSITYAGGVTITGTAKFEIRPSTSSGLGAVDTTNRKAIRYAEVVVNSGSGTIVQCGDTDETGGFSLSVPQSSSSHTILVRSRGSNNYVNASVLDAPSSSAPYEISVSFTPDESKDVGDLIAKGSGNLKGGAFNIFDQIVNANEFLRETVDSTHCATHGCTAFAVAPKVTVYWAKGVNPATYFGYNTPLSFYVPDADTLYILGGVDGDTDNSDTDHYDNSVILHEYGHFIEDQYSKTDSPGGSHNGNAVIDARLAWGEGWANFFQSAITGEPVYRDTYGNPSGTTQGVFFNLDIEASCTSANGGCDYSALSGEGNFREFSITRFFWDFIDPHPVSSQGGDDGESVQGDFAELWTVLSGPFAESSNHFRNVGLFHEERLKLSSATDATQIYSLEKQDSSQVQYARKISKGSCGDYSIQETNSSYLKLQNLASSHQMTTNDFFQYQHSGGNLALTLEYSPASSSDDLDLYIYEEGYTFGVEPIAYSNKSNDGGSEVITTSLSAGVYLINVYVYSGTGTKDYSLSVGGTTLCP